MANIFHVNESANRVKRVLKTRVSIESRVFKTRDAIIINSFKTGHLTILLDTHCYLARGFPDFSVSNLARCFSFLSLKKKKKRKVKV